MQLRSLLHLFNSISGYPAGRIPDIKKGRISGQLDIRYNPCWKFKLVQPKMTYLATPPCIKGDEAADRSEEEGRGLPDEIQEG